MSIIIACGSEYRKLTVPGEKKFLGYGVSYCDTCDICRNSLRQIAAVIGDGATAVCPLLSTFKRLEIELKISILIYLYRR